MLKEPATETTVVAANLPENVPYDVYDIADTFKSFIQDLPGGILGEVELFDSLRKNLPNLQLTNSDLSLDFGCMGLQDSTNPKWIAQILRSVSDKERLNFILVVFGVMASVRATYHSPCSSNIVATPSSGISTRPCTEHSNASPSTPSGQPFLRAMKSTSNIKRPRVFTDPSTPSPMPAQPRIRATKSFWNLSNRSVDTRPAIPLSASNVSMGEYFQQRPFMAHPEYSNVYIFHHPDTCPDHAPIISNTGFQPCNTELNYNAEESSNHTHKFRGTVSVTTQTILEPSPDSPESPPPPKEDIMTSRALGKIFAPLLLGDKLDAVELLTSNRSSTESHASSNTDDSSSHYIGIPTGQPLPQYTDKGKAKVEVGSVPDLVAPMASGIGDAAQKLGGNGGKEEKFSPMRWLKSKKEADGKTFDEVQQRLRLAAWVVECLVKNWEDIVAEYVTGLEGVDAQVECMAAYY
jgi:hypothetical protein